MLGPLLLATCGCAIEDGTAFGAPFSIAATPEPYTEGGHLIFTATYATACAGGGSSFAVTRFSPGADAAEGAWYREAIMLVAAREAANACSSPLPFETEHTEQVRAPLPAGLAGGVGANYFLACPPGSRYEMMKVSERTGGTGARPAFLRSASTPPATRPPDWDDEEDGHWEPPPSADASSDAQHQEPAAKESANASKPKPGQQGVSVDELGGTAAPMAATINMGSH